MQLHRAKSPVDWNQPVRPPAGVTAVRDGNQVTISWEQVEMTKDKDRGYLIEAFVCQDGAYLWWTFSYPDQYSTSYTITDEPGCPAPSQGLLYRGKTWLFQASGYPLACAVKSIRLLTNTPLLRKLIAMNTNSFPLPHPYMDMPMSMVSRAWAAMEGWR